MANETIAPGIAMYRYFFSCGSSAGITNAITW